MERAPLLQTPSTVPTPAVGVGVTVLVVTGCLLGFAFRQVARLQRRDVAAGGNLAPGISGAIASLDLALMYDVLVGHRWRSRGSVRSRRYGPSGRSEEHTSELQSLMRISYADF